MPDPRGERRFFADIDRITGYRTTILLAVPLRDAEGDASSACSRCSTAGAAGASPTTTRSG